MKEIRILYTLLIRCQHKTVQKICINEPVGERKQQQTIETENTSWTKWTSTEKERKNKTTNTWIQTMQNHTIQPRLGRTQAGAEEEVSSEGSVHGKNRHNAKSGYTNTAQLKTWNEITRNLWCESNSVTPRPRCTGWSAHKTTTSNSHVKKKRAQQMYSYRHLKSQ